VALAWLNLKLHTVGVVKARPTQPFFHVMQKIYEKCGLHAGNMKYVTQNEE